MENNIKPPLPIGTRMHEITQGMTMTSRSANTNQIYEITSYDEATGIFEALCVEDDSQYSSSLGRTIKIEERWLARELTRPWNSGVFTMCPGKNDDIVLKSFVAHINSKKI